MPRKMRQMYYYEAKCKTCGKSIIVSGVTQAHLERVFRRTVSFLEELDEDSDCFDRVLWRNLNRAIDAAIKSERGRKKT